MTSPNPGIEGTPASLESVSTPPEPGRILRNPVHTDRGGWLRWLPGLHILRRYESSWFRHDIVAGLVLTTMLVPVGIA